MSSVGILLCTFIGARFLPDQLSSFADQTWRNWSAFASDDGSTDETVATLSQYQEALGSSRVQIRNGPEQGLLPTSLVLPVIHR